MMPKKPLPRILSVKAGEKPYTLCIKWEQGASESIVDVSKQLKSFKIYAPLRNSLELFQSVRTGEYGTDIIWSDELDISADTLWRLTQEQSGFTMSATDFKKWRTKHSYTLDDAAAALGISRRMVAYYERGDRPIPRVVALATIAFDYSENPMLYTG